MARILSPGEFSDSDTVALARGLLGRVLARRLADSSVVRHRIVEVEAYHGHEDRASHASRGLTRRNAPMFEAGGIWYVYLCYGVHEMLNLVTGPPGFPAAILIRGVEGFVGPGRLTRGLAIDRSLNGLPASPDSGLWIEDDGAGPGTDDIVSSPRVGVDYAGEHWASKPWRFQLRARGSAARATRRQSPGTRSARA